MTADNLTFSIEIDFIPDIKEGRSDFQKQMKDAASRYQGVYTLDKSKRPIIAGLSKDDVEKALTDLGLSAFGAWPQCILTCTLNTPLPIRAVGMADGWDIYTGKKTFFAFAQFPADTLQILTKACTYYLERESFQTFDEFVKAMGYEAFRDAVLGNSGAPMDTGSDDYSAWAQPEVPPLAEGDFVRPENNIMQVLQVYPEMGPLLMEYGMSCVGCFISYDENIWQACQAHGMDVFEILGEMNEYISDKYNKPLLTKDTPMEDILTLYPQLLSIFQDAGLKMPADMQTTIGAMCEAGKVDVKDLIGKCDEKLRKDI